MNSEDIAINWTKITDTDIELLSNVLRAQAHEKRLKLLILLCQHDVLTFEEVITYLDVKRTAASNHIKQLEEFKLLFRKKQGQYQITKDGQLFLESLVRTYLSTTIHKERFFQQLSDRSSMYLRREELMMTEEKKIVKKLATYAPCNMSYYGAIAGVFQSLGFKVDLADVAGYTGYGFITNVTNGMTDPSGPTALGEKIWTDFNTNLQNLGIKCELYFEEPGYFEKKPTPGDVARAKKMFDVIATSIQNDKPAVVWGIPLPEFGIVNGIDDEHYLVSTFRHLNNEEETSIRYDKIQAAGMLHVTLFGEKCALASTEDDKKAILRGIEYASNLTTFEHYSTGPRAYEAWADVLETKTSADKYLDPFGNSYAAECFGESKCVTAKFLERLATKYAGKPQSDALLKASKEYGTIADLFQQFLQLFDCTTNMSSDYDKKSHYSDNNRLNGADLLRSMASHEKQFIDYLKIAASIWK